MIKLKRTGAFRRPSTQTTKPTFYDFKVISEVQQVAEQILLT